MKERSFNNISQTEALLNELKGNLFEYLVAVELSKIHGVYSQFVTSFSGYAKEQFIEYESWIRSNAPNVLTQLPPLAKETAKTLNLSIEKEVKSIQVVGKIISENSDLRGHNECDLLIHYDDESLLPISLKLCKANAFVNTKSGGIRSFISKYFCDFKASESLQYKLNQCVDSSFQYMGHQLYELAGLSFKGNFDHQWTDSGHSELPGQLTNEFRSIIHQSYQSIVKQLYTSVVLLHKEDRELFSKAIHKLMGFSGNSIQFICYYKKTYQFDSVKVTDSKSIQEISGDFKVLPLKDHLSSFEIQLKDRLLQIRIKPMNKFTASAHKVNCSVKIV